MARVEISEHEVRLFQQVAKDPALWWTSDELAVAANVAPRTARLHCQRFTEMRIFSKAKLFPKPRYRLADGAADRHRAYFARLTQAQEVFGL